MFRFVHTADIHLDSPLRSLLVRDPELSALIRVATRSAFEGIIDLCLNEQVNALIIAGDLYDGDQRSMKTAAFLSHQMRRLEEAGIRVFMIRGNHDAESKITRHLDLPANVHVYTGHGGVEELPELGVAIHGVSFSGRHAPQSLLPKYRPPLPGLVNIGIMHTSLAGDDRHDDYAPCSLNDLTGHGYDYWALGHIHKRKVHAQNPFVVMPGIPQGRDIGEAGQKSVTLVEISDAGIALHERPVAIAEFHRIDVCLDAADDWQNALGALRGALERARNDVSAEHTICRVALRGRTSLGWRLRRDDDLLLAEAREAANEIGGVWIEQIENNVVPPAPAAASIGADPLEELAVLMQEVSKDRAFLNDAVSYLDEMVRALPSELRDRFGSGQSGSEAILTHLLADGIADVIAALKRGHSGSLPN